MSRLPSRVLTPEEYVAERVEDQRKWYENRAERYKWFRVVVGGIVALLSTAAGFLGVAEPGCLSGTTLCVQESHLTALSSALTSIGVAVTGWATLNSTEYLGHSYRSTAKQIRLLLKDWYDGVYARHPDAFQRFVEDVEGVLAREHAAWGKHTSEVLQPAQPPQEPAAAAPEETDEGEVGRVGGSDDSFDPPVR